MPMTSPRPTRGLRSLLRASTAAALAVALAACSPGTTAGGAAGAGSSCAENVAKQDAKLVLGVGSFSSAYWQEVIRGAQAVADSVGVPLTTYQSNYDGQTMLNTLSSSLAAGGRGTAIIADPASNAFTKPIVQAAQQAGAHIVTLWNRPVDAHPWDFGGGCWIAHTAFDGTESGQRNSEELFKQIGGQGGIVALQGIPDDPSNKQRLYGLQQALAQTPGVQLLDVQTANWTASTAQTVVNAWLAKYPGQIKGIFSANDDMAVGAAEALRSKGLNGAIPVTGSDGSQDMLSLVKSGDALSTMQNDAFGQGAYATAIAYASLVGDIEAETLTPAQRDFFLKTTFVTGANVDQAMAVGANFDPARYSYDALKGNLWADVSRQIEDSTWIPAAP